MKFSSLSLLLAATSAAAQTASTGSGQAWPEKPIRLVVGFPPGGSGDFIARKRYDTAQKVFAAPQIRERLAREGLAIETSPSAQDFAVFSHKAIPFWAQVVLDSGATAD